MEEELENIRSRWNVFPENCCKRFMINAIYNSDKSRAVDCPFDEPDEYEYSDRYGYGCCGYHPGMDYDKEDEALTLAGAPEDIRYLLKYIEDLKKQLYYQPDGPGMEEAKEDFNTRSKMEKVD